MSSDKQKTLILSSLPTAQLLQSTLASLTTTTISPLQSSIVSKTLELDNKKEQNIIKEYFHDQPTNNLSTTTFKEENLANISISEKTLTEDINNLKLDLSPQQQNRRSSSITSFLASPSPPLVKNENIDQQQQRPSQSEVKNF